MRQLQIEEVAVPANHAEQRDRVTTALTPVLNDAGLDLEAVELKSAGRRTVLRVVVDSDRGVALDDLAELTPTITGVLDNTEVMGAGNYTLEVTSPGTDRPLTLPRHWRRNSGRLVSVTLVDGQQLSGRIRAAGETAAEFDVAGEAREVAYAEIARARVEVEFNRRSAAAAPEVEAAGEAEDGAEEDEEN